MIFVVESRPIGRVTLHIVVSVVRLHHFKVYFVSGINRGSEIFIILEEHQVGLFLIRAVHFDCTRLVHLGMNQIDVKFGLFRLVKVMKVLPIPRHRFPFAVSFEDGALTEQVEPVLGLSLKLLIPQFFVGDVAEGGDRVGLRRHVGVVSGFGHHHTGERPTGTELHPLGAIYVASTPGVVFLGAV